MSTYQNQNQFAQTPLLGQVDLIAGPNNVISCQIDPASTATAAQLTAGSPMKIVDVAGTQIIVDTAAITDVATGVIIYNPRKNIYVAGDTIELGCSGTVVYLETSAAIARGVAVQAATADGLVATRTGASNAGLGIMIDKPAAANVLARVQIRPTTASGTTLPLVSTASTAVANITSSQNTTTVGSDPTTTQALANALQISYNAAQVDIAALRAELLSLRAACLAAGITS